jgi:hypothetical protein
VADPWSGWDETAPLPEDAPMPEPDPRAEAAIRELAEAQAELDRQSAEFNAKAADLGERAAIAHEPPPEFSEMRPEAPQDDRGFETAPEFVDRIQSMPPMSWLVDELLPDEGIVAWHGRPRSMKSLCALETSLALTQNRPAFGNDRFGCPHGALSVLYLTEEDSERLFAFRLNLLLAAEGCPALPALLRIRIRPGWNLESADGQAALIEAVHRCQPEPRVLVIDPARGSLPSVDGGPKDAAEAVGFLRLILRETSVKTLLLPHHDLKPNREKEDLRPRPERASGGIVFSIADCPVNFERVDERTCLAVPSHYKVSNDPLPFRVRFESATPIGEPFRDWLRATGATQTEEQTTDERDRQKVLDYVRENPKFTGTEIDQALRLGKGTANRLLEHLRLAGLVEFVDGKQHGRSSRAKLWFPASEVPPAEPDEEE